MASSKVLKEHFFSVAARVESMGSKIDPSNVHSLRDARLILIDIISELRNMVSYAEQLEDGDDSVQNILREVNALLQQTTGLRGHLDKAIALQPTIAAVASSSGTQRPASSPASAARARSLENQVLTDNVPLSREEIAKLLMITARAYKMKILSDKQRSFVKMVICKQEGYLRVILSFEGTEQIFSALLAVGGEADGEERHGSRAPPSQTSRLQQLLEEDDDDSDDDDSDDDSEDDEDEEAEDYEDEYEALFDDEGNFRNSSSWEDVVAQQDRQQSQRMSTWSQR